MSDEGKCECGHTLQPSGFGDFVCVMGCSYEVDRQLERSRERYRGALDRLADL